MEVTLIYICIKYIINNLVHHRKFDLINGLSKK